MRETALEPAIQQLILMEREMDDLELAIKAKKQARRLLERQVIDMMEANKFSELVVNGKKVKIAELYGNPSKENKELVYEDLRSKGYSIQQQLTVTANPNELQQIIQLLGTHGKEIPRQEKRDTKLHHQTFNSLVKEVVAERDPEFADSFNIPLITRIKIT